MSGPESLFATKLKRHRLEAGEHGRMTQEQLAELLGVSLDAVSKYERSLSFIRGDLEHRLGERLGWSRDKVLACREDWEGRQHGETHYRLMDEKAVESWFGGSWRAAAEAAVLMSFEELGDIPDVLMADSSVYSNISSVFHDQSACVLQGGSIVAQWFVVPLIQEDENAFLERRFLEETLSPERVCQPILPGTIFGYCPALIVSKGHERASALLLTSFVDHLEVLARRGVLYRGIGTMSCTPAGAQICRDLGMERLGAYLPDPESEVWNITGAGIARSIFARKSAVVREAYAREFL